MKIEKEGSTLSFTGVQTNELSKNESGEIIFISIEQGKEITSHKSNTDASILVLEGNVNFKINGEEYLLKKHDMFSFKKGENHAVEGISNAKLILIK